MLFHAYTDWMHMPYLLDSNEMPNEYLPRPKGFPINWEEFDGVLKNYLVSHVSDIFTKETIIKNPEIFQADPLVRSQKIADYFEWLDSQKDYTKRKSAWNPPHDAYMQFINTHNPQDVAYLHMMYESRVHRLDTQLAWLITYLLRPDVASHTIVVITSSHGEAFGEHGTFEHVSIPYNELYHVPLIIKYPKGVGRQVDAVVENIDLYPTLTELVTGKTPKTVEGISLVPLLSGLSVQAKSYAVSMNYDDSVTIQTKRYALIVYRNSNFKSELYDLQNGPTEQYDIASKYPDIVKRYTQLLKQTHIAPEFFIPSTPSSVPPSVDKKDLIRSGYF